MVGDIYIKSQMSQTFGTQRNVASGTAASINNGEPTKEANSTANGNVAIMVDGNGTSSERFTGVAKSVSTDTVAAAGIVELWAPLPGLTYGAKAKTAALANTSALVEALKGKRVIFDLTGTSWTVDTGAGDSATNAVVIIGGEYQTSTIYFVYMNKYTNFGS